MGKAVSDEIRQGADQKLIAGVRVTSQLDPIDQLQYSGEEISTVVDEATQSRSYVMAHYTRQPESDAVSSTEYAL